MIAIRFPVFATSKSTPPLPPFLTNDGGLQVDKNSAWHVLAGGSLKEEGVEGIVMLVGLLFFEDLAVGPDVVLQTVQLPAGVADLHAALAQVNRDALPLCQNKR